MNRSVFPTRFPHKSKRLPARFLHKSKRLPARFPLESAFLTNRNVFGLLAMETEAIPTKTKEIRTIIIINNIILNIKLQNMID